MKTKLYTLNNQCNLLVIYCCPALEYPNIPGEDVKDSTKNCYCNAFSLNTQFTLKE